MSTAALLWVHDEPDVLAYNIPYLLTQVDEVLIRLRDPVPEVRKVVNGFGRHERVQIEEGDSRYDQSAQVTEMMLQAMERGHEWVVPVDPDEIWYTNGKPIRETLGGVSKDVAIAKAELYNHVASGQDPNNESNPFRKIGWRQKFPLPLGKVAVRCRPDLTILQGNHYARTRGVALAAGPILVVRHFPYRTPEQFVERVRSAWTQLKASDQPESSGIHIRAYGKCLDEEGEQALVNHFRHWFYALNPDRDDSLIYDPAPV